MKQPFLILFTLVFGFNIIYSQKKLTENEKLFATAKVWGFLKYYHPSVSEGNFDWDNELFKILPKVKESTNAEQLSEIYINWIESLGEVETCKKCSRENKSLLFENNFDLGWIDGNLLISDKLSQKLKFIEQNRHLGEKHYITYSNTGSIKVINEIDYADFDWNNKNLRILTLFRYWNIVEYFFPYKYQMDSPWNEVLYKMIPKFLNPRSAVDFHLALMELVAHLDDGHANISTDLIMSFFGDYWMPQKIELVEDKAVVTEYYNEKLAKPFDLRIGDVITKLDNKTLDELLLEKEKYISGSNISKKKQKASYTIFRGSNDSVRVEYIREGKRLNTMIKRFPLDNLNYNWAEERKGIKETYKIFDGNIGYVNLGRLTIKEVPKVMKALESMKAIIFDIRNYPQATLFSISNYITSNKSDFYKLLLPNLDYPGQFIWGHTGKAGNNKLKYTGTVVLLVSEKTQSHAEFTTMCLQTGDNVTTIGSQTAGADGNISRFDTVGGFKTQMSGLGIFYPDGTETQRVGIRIDIEVKPTIDGIKQGRDEVLEKAMEFIKQN
ncbi:peptidase S41 [Arenibacter sp. 6A1]|uniref:S41 family peptidase n=1 Tax=Arenibacter sp. 6A1 TaxID=2720391 RepID=UPI001448437F|nr:S41 family peptidase [Arenibacter sp. 6A1]NKI28322.1 peptidase S41 [Arenibacter sp. 6A1]